MSRIPFALYDAFADTPFGGSQAAVVDDAAGIDFDLRRRIAREIGMPATAFVDAWGADWIEVQFLSTVMELPMCGHGTICLLTYMLDCGRLDASASAPLQLRLPNSNARVDIDRRADGRNRALLEVTPPIFDAPPPHAGELLGLLGLGADALDQTLPLETARGDFAHLIVPLAGLDVARAIRADFAGLVDYCNRYGIETVAVFCGEVEHPGNTIHVRDFCPAVGVSESAAAGTTNAALSCYLLRHGLLPTSDRIDVFAEQGIELGRPSSIESRIETRGNAITRLQVGGVASKVIDGYIYL